MSVVFLFLVVFLSPALCSPFHFYTSANSKRCFYKHLDDLAIFVGRYRLEISHDSTTFAPPLASMDTGVVVTVEEVFNRNHRVVHQRGPSSGQFTFSPLGQGEHRICFTPKSFYNRWKTSDNTDAAIDSKFVRARVLIDVAIGDTSSIDSRAPVRQLAQAVAGLNDKLAAVRSMQTAIRAQEESFRDLSEHIGDMVVLSTAIEIVAVVGTSVYKWARIRSVDRAKVKVA